MSITREKYYNAREEKLETYCMGNELGERAISFPQKNKVW